MNTQTVLEQTSTVGDLHRSLGILPHSHYSLCGFGPEARPCWSVSHLRMISEAFDESKEEEKEALSTVPGTWYVPLSLFIK